MTNGLCLICEQDCSTRVQSLKKWGGGVDLNHRPVGYEPNALSAELPRQKDDMKEK